VRVGFDARGSHRREEISTTRRSGTTSAKVKELSRRKRLSNLIDTNTQAKSRGTSEYATYFYLHKWQRDKESEAEPEASHMIQIRMQKSFVKDADLDSCLIHIRERAKTQD
jgi:hypothetical protein